MSIELASPGANCGAIPERTQCCKLVKEREGETSQLNRLGTALNRQDIEFVGAQPSALHLSRPGSNNFNNIAGSSSGSN